MKKLFIIVLSLSTFAYGIRSGRGAGARRTTSPIQRAVRVQRLASPKRSIRQATLQRPRAQRIRRTPISRIPVAQQRTIGIPRIQQRVPSLTTLRQPTRTRPLTRQPAAVRPSIIRGRLAEQPTPQPRTTPAVITGRTFERSRPRRRPSPSTIPVSSRPAFRHRHRRRPLIQNYYLSTGYIPYDSSYSDLLPYYGGFYSYPYYRSGTPGFYDDTNIVRPEILGIDPTEYPYYSDLPTKTATTVVSPTAPPLFQPLEEPYYEESELESPITTETPEATITLITPQAQQQPIDSTEVLQLMDTLLQENLKDVHELS